MIPKLPNSIARLGAALGLCATVSLTFWVFAIAQDDAPPNRRATDLVRQATERLQQYSSLKAKIRYSGRLYGHEIVGTGVYLQDASNEHLQWQTEWNLQVGDKKSFRREVCNGDSLWIESRSDQIDIELARVNLRKVRAEAEERRIDSRTETEKSSQPLVETNQLGGFPGFLGSLNDQVKWNRVEPSQLGKDRVWVVHGDLLQPPHSPELPNHVRLILAQDGEFQLFPFRIEWYHRTAKETKRFLVVDYFSISANHANSAGAFEFDPGDRDYADQTEDYLNSRRGTMMP